MIIQGSYRNGKANFQDIFTFFNDKISPIFQLFFGGNGRTDGSRT